MNRVLKFVIVAALPLAMFGAVNAQAKKKPMPKAKPAMMASAKTVKHHAKKSVKKSAKKVAAKHKTAKAKTAKAKKATK